MNSNHIGQRIRERRIELGATQKWLAKETGYSRIYIVKLEKGQIKNPGVKTLEKITGCLGINMEVLWK